MVAARVSPDADGVEPWAGRTRLRAVGSGGSWGDDVDAFARVYDETSTRVYGVVLRVVRDPAQAEEVTQEAYLEIWRQAKRYDSARGSTTSWLITIAHRRAVDRVRSVEASRRRDQNDHARCCRVGLDDETSEAVVRLEEMRMVRAALAALSVQQRRAIELAYFGGHTHAEVARLLEIPLGTAKSRIRDGLIQLRTSLEGV